MRVCHAESAPPGNDADRRDGLGEQAGTVLVQPAGDVALGDDAVDPLSVGGDDEGADVVLGEQRQRRAHALPGVHGGDLVALAAQQLADLHDDLLRRDLRLGSVAQHAGAGLDHRLQRVHRALGLSLLAQADDRVDDRDRDEDRRGAPLLDRQRHHGRPDEEKIDTFLPVLDEMMESGLVTLEKARVLQYGRQKVSLLQRINDRGKLMKTTTIVAMALAIGALGACKKSPNEQAAENVESNYSNAAANVEASTSNAAEAIQSNAENAASEVKAAGKNEAASIKNEGAEKAKEVRNSGAAATNNAQ